jgi:dTDP-4-amino-4,6-dideoxygalactose transaminase
LCDIAHALGKTSKTVLIPAYTCQTVITPFEEAGWKCEFYSIRRDLRIDADNLLVAVEKYHPSLVVAHPYFGMDLNVGEIKALMAIKEQGIAVVLDLTQCLFTANQYPFASFVVASYRKWMPIPDGGYLKNLNGKVKICQPKSENEEFTDRELAAMYLRGQYFANGEQRTKDISIRLSKSADHLADSNTAPHKMSQVAYNLMQNENLEVNQQRRFENYTYLYQYIRESDKVTKVCKNINDVTTAPLYFTIFVDDRPSLQRQLAQDAVYAPVIWPIEDERVLTNDEVKYIYDHILAIPIDQRYDVEDMKRVVEIINKF